MSISRSQWKLLGVMLLGIAVFVVLPLAHSIYEQQHRVLQMAPARPMTREDVVCDWPNRTIRLKPGIYDWSVIRAVELCGWIVDGEGTITINGSSATTTEGHVETPAATFSGTPSQWKVPDQAPPCFSIGHALKLAGDCR